MKSFADLIAEKKRASLPSAAAPAKKRPKTPKRQKPFVRKKTKELITKEKRPPKQAYAIANKLAREREAKRKKAEQKRRTGAVDKARAMERRSSSTPRARSVPMAGKKGKGGEGKGPKKPRSAAQRAATARMIAANKAKSGGGGSRALAKRGGGGGGGTTRPKVAAGATKTKSGEMVVAYAMENNIGLAEGVVGGVVSIVYFFVGDLVLALTQTHKLQPPASMPTDGSTPVYTDKPDKGQNYNVIAADAPLGILGWIVGVVIIGAPLAIARFAFEPGLGRSTFNFMGIAGILTVGNRGGRPAIAYMLRKTGLGQQVYAPQVNAQQAAWATKQAVAKDPNFTLAPAPAIPLAAGQWLTPPQAGVANPNEPNEAQRRQAGMGAPHEQHNAAPPPPAPPTDAELDAGSAPPPRERDAAPPANSNGRGNVTPMFSPALRERFTRRAANA